MILSVSRRTDIPAFYSEWFFNRIKEGFVYVRNPMNIHQISKIDLSPKVVDCIVFWTKNPKPMLSRLDELKKYNYYFQFTVNSYTNDIEANVPSKTRNVVRTFTTLSEKIGAEKIIWRYDPIIINDRYTFEYHKTNFERLAQSLNGYFSKCVISFVDAYKKNTKNFKENDIYELSNEAIFEISETLSDISRKYGFEINTCAEGIDLSRFGIKHGKCIDDKYIEKLIGQKLNIKKDPNQRTECGCVESVDIGLYNTCMHGCKYCYANYSSDMVVSNHKKYNVDSPLLCSYITDSDHVSERKVQSLIEDQLQLW